MGGGQTVIERDRAVGGREYVRGEVFLVREREKEGVTLRNIVSLLKVRILNFRYIIHS